MRSSWLNGFAVGLLIGAVATFAMSQWVVSTHDYQKDLLKVYRQVRVGGSAGEMAHVIVSTVRHATFAEDRSGTLVHWYISAPPEFFQGQWILIVCLESDIISGARFGIGDDVTVRPASAPRVLGTCE